MRTSTLALFRDFHDDNRPAQDPQGETSKKTSEKERMTGMAQGVTEGIGGDVRRTYSFGGVGNRPW